ncbi:MAG: hypothetical protein ACRDQ6_23795, partial [Pseudonocardiaceae bacterium]
MKAESGLHSGKYASERGGSWQAADRGQNYAGDQFRFLLLPVSVADPGEDAANQILVGDIDVPMQLRIPLALV